MSTNLDFKELINVIENVTPYYYVKKFQNKIKNLIKEARKFDNDDKKIIYLVNNMNDIHFYVRKLEDIPRYLNLSGFVILYTKKNGDKFTSKRDGKYVVIKSEIDEIKVGDEIISFDDMKVLDIINNLINSYEIPYYNPIRTLGDLQERSLELLFYYTPKEAIIKRNNKELTVKLDKTKKIVSRPVKKQFYKEIKINNKDTFYFSIKSFNIKYINKEEYLETLEYLKDNIDKYEYIILDLRKNGGGDRKYVELLLKAIYGNKINHYVNNLERMHHVYKLSDILLRVFEKYHDKDKIDIAKREMKKGKKYVYIPKVRREKKIFRKTYKEYLKKNIKFKGKLIVFMDFGCGSTCSILLELLKTIRKEFGLSIIFLGTEDGYDTKFTHPYSIDYKNYRLTVPTKYRKYRIRDDYETIKPDYYYFDTTYELNIPVNLIEKIINKKGGYYKKYKKYKNKYIKLKNTINYTL